MYGLIGRLNSVTGQREALIAILLESTQRMPGCKQYVVARDAKDENAVWISEVWTDAESHQASLQLPEVQRAIARAKPLIASFGEYHATEPVGGYGW